MTTFDAAAPAAPAAPTPRSMHGPVSFLGRDRDYWWLMIRGSVLLAMTLGIYRFWLTTDQRRFLWSNTAVLGQPLEYTGTAREILIGFLIAVAILIPIYGLIFLLAFDLGLIGRLAGVIGFALLSVLGQFAVYRARRYRLTRTIFRGVRFYQTGSALLYALYATLWWIAIVLSLGLAFPWAQATLERFKMCHTYLGNLQGRFEGTGWQLFLRGFLLWLVTVGPLVGAALMLALQLDGQIIQDILDSDGDLSQTAPSRGDLGRAFAFARIAVLWSLTAALLLYPVFQAIVLRWWASGLRFDVLSTSSKLRVGQVYGAYLAFIGYCVLFTILAGIASGIIVAMIFGFGNLDTILDASGTAEIAGAIGGIAIYVAMALAYSVIYHVKLKLAIWRKVAQSIELENPAILETITSAGAPASPVGEGLADALNVGGY